MVYFLKRCSDFFRSKKVIVVSDFGIKTRQVTSFSKCLQVTYFLWFVFATIMFVFNTKIQLNKDKVIDELKTVNANLSNRIVDIESIVDDVNGYLLILNSYDRFNDINIKVLDIGPVFSVNHKLKSIKKFLYDASKILNIKIEIKKCVATSDAIYFSEKNIPAILMNPKGDYWHNPKEYVELDSLYTLYEIFKTLL